MTNIKRADEGPLGNPNPTDNKKSSVDPAKFQEAMRQKIGETDPEQEKKKKQQEEETEEAPPATTQQEPTTTPSTTGDSSFLSVQKGTQQSFRSSSVQGESYTPPPITSSPSSFDEESVSENDALNVEPSSTTSYTSSSQTTPTQTTSPSTESQKTPATHAAEGSQDKKQHKDSSPFALPITPAKETLPLAEDLQTKMAAFQEGIAAPQSTAPADQGVAAAPLQGILEPSKPPPEKLKTQTAASLLEEEAMLIPKEGMMLITAPKEVSPADPFARLPLAIQEMFTKMLGVILVMQQTPGVKETSFILNNPKFASSVFFGSQIIIKEFSTAPLVFNIQLNGSQQATALFQKNLDDLAAAFQAGQQTFKVNRLETGYLSEKPLFHRKRGLADEGTDTGEQR